MKKKRWNIFKCTGRRHKQTTPIPCGNNETPFKIKSSYAFQTPLENKKLFCKCWLHFGFSFYFRFSFLKTDFYYFFFLFFCLFFFAWNCCKHKQVFENSLAEILMFVCNWPRFISYLQHECGQRIKLLTHNIMSFSQSFV